MVDWKLEHLRLTAFPAMPIADGLRHWHDVVQEEPEQDSKQRQAGVSTYVAEKTVGEGVLSLRVERDGEKVDWVLGAPSAFSTPTSSPIVGEIQEYLPTFDQIITGFVERAALEAQRLAFGCVLLAPVDSRQEGYAQLDRLLRDVRVDPEASDFYYRINRRRDSSVIDRPINRVSEWSVARMLNIDVVDGAASNARKGTEFMTRLRVDVNTAPEVTEPIPVEAQLRLFEEMKDMGWDISKQGDQA